MSVMRALPILVLVAAAGCSASAEKSAESPAHDAEKARSALVAALDAWKKSEAKALPKRDPPIRFVDDDFATGLRLSDYEIEEPDRPIAMHEDVAVILSLRDKRGTVIRREARYQVATGRGLAVLRSDR